MKKHFPLILTLVIATTAALANEAGGHAASHGSESVTIPWIDIRNQAINLGILLAALIYFIREPMKQTFKAKKDLYLEEAIKTEAALKLAEKELAENKKRLADLESTEAQALATAQTEAVKQSAKHMVESAELAEKMTKDVDLVLATEANSVKNQIREKIIAKSMGTAEQTIKDSADAITKKSEPTFLRDLEKVNSGSVA